MLSFFTKDYENEKGLKFVILFCFQSFNVVQVKSETRHQSNNLKGTKNSQLISASKPDDSNTESQSLPLSDPVLNSNMF